MPEPGIPYRVPTKYQGSEPERLALDVLIKLNRAADSVTNGVLSHLNGTNVSPTQFGILDALYHLGPLSLGQIARKHLKSANNITSVVDTMERSGLVVRERQVEDRRMVKLHLTPEGEALFEAHWPNHLQTVVKTMSVLSPDELKQLSDLLRRLGKSAAC